VSTAAGRRTDWLDDSQDSLLWLVRPLSVKESWLEKGAQQGLQNFRHINYRGHYK